MWLEFKLFLPYQPKLKCRDLCGPFATIRILCALPTSLLYCETLYVHNYILFPSVSSSESFHILPSAAAWMFLDGPKTGDFDAMGYFLSY